ncbi:MAG: PSD1 and planctomycete cytochrome C domain-containing protein [Planctomycetaceae bacterium]
MPVIFVLLIGLLFSWSVRADDVAPPLTFEKDIRPIFRAHCYDCHGATEELKGGLDMRLVRFMQAGGESGTAIVPGRPEESYLLDRVKNGEMPPGKHTVPASEIQILESWIADGAKTARPEPDTIPPGLGLTPEERSFWSFQPIQPPNVEDVSSFPEVARVRTPIDALLLRSMPEGHGFAADADRRTLIRRAFFDLIGLPPSPEELQTWAEDTADDWYDRLLTDLLNSPHYGERWGRHWLDIAGYADSEGVTTSDADRPWAWKYRDWVIRSLNTDKPFDRFLTEQLAGDELAGPKNGDFTTEQIDLLTATGFLRMAADGTGSGANTEEARNQVVSDTLKILGTSVLGLSIQCAQCHDHRYDPIPQTDYYALRAVFEPALDWKAWQVPNGRRVSLYTQANQEDAAKIEAETKVVSDARAKKLAEYLQQALETETAKFDEPLRSELKTAYNTAADKRTEEQKALLAKNPSVNINAGNLYQYIPDSQPELAKFDKQIAEIRAKKPPEEFVRALVEPASHVPETKLFFRGDHQQPKQSVLPGALTVTADEGERVEFPVNDESVPTTGRRLALAKWLTNGTHPLVARVIVNRVWMHHFGRGLVSTPTDFGKLGTQPTHPELLDWLADDFMKNGWSLKTLHRRIMMSTAWRQTAETAATDAHEATVPYARQSLVRLDAETIRDRMLAASGQLDRTLYGRPVEIKEDDTGQVIVDGSQTRRSLYIKAKRSRPVAMLQAFDAPVMQTNCEIRQHSTVATQSLMLMNGEFTLEQAGKLADRAASEAEDLDPVLLATLPAVKTPASDWIYGFGDYDPATDRTSPFTPFGHFTGTHWQVGPTVPDPNVGWAFLYSTGGHPDTVGRAVIRRLTVSFSGTISVSGKLSHGSENGDGVRGRIVSSRSGKVGEWPAFHSEVATPLAGLSVEPGDTIDFLVDCNTNQTSDSFTWPVTVSVAESGQPPRTVVLADEFRGPVDSSEAVPGQIVRAWQLALCRTPTDAELHLAVEFVGQQIHTLHSGNAKLPTGRTVVRQALVSLCQSLFSSNEFLYVE